MNGELATLADLDSKIQEFTDERQRLLKLYRDPKQREEREKLRERLVGLHVMGRIRQGAPNANTWLPSVIKSAGDRAWVFDAEVMVADGYVSKPAESGRGVVWSRSRPPSDGAGP